MPAHHKASQFSWACGEKTMQSKAVFACPFVHAFLFLGGFYMNIIFKNHGKRITCAILFLSVIFCSFILSSCNKKDSFVLKDSNTCIAISVNEDLLDGKSDMPLIDYMTKLKENGELDFTIENGMVVSINGIKNTANFSKCWMLYTSDSEYSNPSWGTVMYNENEYGSAMLGADLLVVKPDNLYIWVYNSLR